MRSAHLQSKKAKALGIDIATLADQDIMFINSLVTRDITKLGAMCGVQFIAITLEDMAFKLKSMKWTHYKPLSVGVVQTEAF